MGAAAAGVAPPRTALALDTAQASTRRQAEFEEKWDTLAVKNYGEAKTLAEKTMSAK